MDNDWNAEPNEYRKIIILGDQAGRTNLLASMIDQKFSDEHAPRRGKFLFQSSY